MTERMFTVPSGAQVPVDEYGFIETDVILDISALIDHDFEGVLDLLSLGATDTELLSEIEYTATSLTEQGNLVFKVRGNISMIDDMEADNG